MVQTQNQHFQAWRAIRDFKRWTISAKPGAVLIYWRGFLSIDRGEGETLNTEINTFARYVWQCQEKKKVFLFQRRKGKWQYEYWAVRSPLLLEKE